MRTKLLDVIMFYSIGGMAIAWIAGVALDAEGGVTNGFEMTLAVLILTSILAMIFMMLVCLMKALDLPKGTEKNLWILGLFFMSPITIPYFYFSDPVGKKKESNQSGDGQ